MSKASLGHKRHTAESRKLIGLKNSVSLKGRKLTLEHRQNIGKECRGKNHWNWKGGITENYREIRNKIEYKEWRNSVFKRDEYTCQDCGKTGCYLEAHHINPVSKFFKLKYDVLNGRTLCLECHNKTKWGRNTSHF
jgi:hypothetical protein